MNKPEPEGIDHQKLRADLGRLHAELRAIRTIDEEEQKLLRLLDSDIEELLARKDDDLRPNPTRVSASARRWRRSRHCIRACRCSSDRSLIHLLTWESKVSIKENNGGQIFLLN